MSCRRYGLSHTALLKQAWASVARAPWCADYHCSGHASMLTLDADTGLCRYTCLEFCLRTVPHHHTPSDSLGSLCLRWLRFHDLMHLPTKPQVSTRWHQCLTSLSFQQSMLLKGKSSFILRRHNKRTQYEIIESMRHV